MMAGLSAKLTVDTKDIDRIAIGMRLYDMLDMQCAINKLHNDDGQLYINEKDIVSMYRLVNNDSLGRYRNIVVYRSDEDNGK